jgi:Spermine/spermidine synthase domain
MSSFIIAKLTKASSVHCIEMNALPNDNNKNAPFHPAAPFPLVKLSPSYLLAVFALLNAFSFFVGFRIRMLEYYALNFSRNDSRSSLFWSLACGSAITNQMSFVEFMSCREHLIDSECITSHYLIDGSDETGINCINQAKQKVSWNKVTTGHSNVYYEAMVHPALLVHDNPRRIVIMNDVSGGVLREALKHSTVQEVIFIVPNAKIVLLAREHLSEWNDCSSFLANTLSCYDDPRVQILNYDDPMLWFRHSAADRIDVVFADATMYV